MKYVRIEYPGIAYQPDNEINGLTFGGVGNKTEIDYIQVSFSGDDAFEWFGGTVNCKHLIAYKAWDDDFDTDFGYSGKIQFALAIRDNNIADVSQSNGFESDNTKSGGPLEPFTSAVFSNITHIGPAKSAGNISPNYQASLHVRRNSRLKVFNSIFFGFPIGLIIDGESTINNAIAGEMMFGNNFLLNHSESYSLKSQGSATLDIAKWLGDNKNVILADDINTVLKDPISDIQNEGYTLASGSAASMHADFSKSVLQDMFFENVSYSGAFGNQNWTNGWVNWNPQLTAIEKNAPMELPISIYPNPTSGFVTLNLENDFNLLTEIQLLDMQGKVVFQSTISLLSITTHINVESIPAGTYLFRVLNEAGSYSQLLTIQK